MIEIPVSILGGFETMNDPNEINESLKLALAVIDDADDLKGALSSDKSFSSQQKTDPKKTKDIDFLNDQVLRSATRILFAENEMKTTRTESSDNAKKLKSIESQIRRQEQIRHRIQCERTQKEKDALQEFKSSVSKARQKYIDAKRVYTEKRHAKLQLVAAGQERLDILRISHEEIGRAYDQKCVELEQKLKRERLLYTLSLESLVEAQQKLKDKEEQEKKKDDGADDDESCSTTDQSFFSDDRSTQPPTPTHSSSAPASSRTTRSSRIVEGFVDEEESVFQIC